jgi:hypothetical protein
MTSNFIIQQSITFHRLLATILALTLAWSATTTPVARAAATIFVRPDGSDILCNGTVNVSAASAPNCAFATIQKGVNSVDPGGSVNVAAGTYNENVNVNKTIALRGAQVGVDARTRTGTPASESILSNGLYASANNVLIDGFTIQGADAIGDFGPGIYLPGTFSGYQIFNNIFQNNIFGLYLNSSGVVQSRIQRNFFKTNNLPGAASGDAIYSDQGLVNALIDNNKFVGNPVAAVDLSRVQPPAQSNITISNNSIEGSGRPFILLNLTSATIKNNIISGATLAASGAIRIYGGVNGLSVTGNTIVGGAGYAMRISDNFPSSNPNANISAHFNRIAGNSGGIMIDGGYSGTLNAENNWWGCNAGPGGAGCNSAGGGVDFNPWLTLKITAAPNSIFAGSASKLTADLIINSIGVNTSPLGYILDGTPVTFAGTLGTLSPTTGYTSGGKAQSAYMAGSVPGVGSASATLDSQTVATPITINPKLNSTTSVTSSANPSVFGQGVTFTAIVSAVPPGSLIPSGTVTFKEGPVTLGTATLNGSGQATLSTAQLRVGGHPITAFYSGDSAFNPSNNSAAPFLQTVNKANTTTTITSDAPDPSLVGQTVTVSFAVAVNAPGSGPPTGLVTVSAAGKNCTNTIAAGSCNVILNNPGHINLTATYAGDGNFNGSSGTASHEVVLYRTYLPIVFK